MCGLAGLACATPGCNVDHTAIVQRMCDAIACRGPDDSGIDSHDGVCLGSRRLAIQDLSPAGHMPMTDETGRWSLAYNGELYNAPDLKDELLALGHSFRSTGDTEVLLKALAQWGKAVLPRLMGIFAFALQDRTTGEVMLVRDHFGIKPLYYMALNGHVLFSSELKTLVRESPAPKVDRMSLVEWSLYRNIDSPSPETLVDGVLSVLPGEVVTIHEGRIHRGFYYRPADAVKAEEYRRFQGMRPEAVVDEIDAALTKVVQEQLVSDVPVGTLLSGGLDSSLITAISGKFRKDLKAFHVSVAGSGGHDEQPFAEALCKEHGLQLVPMRLDGPLFRRTLARVTWLSDLPLTHPNSVAYHLISKVAREHGVIVLLSGEGADELFGGYAWAYRRRKRLAALRPWLDRIPPKLREYIALLIYAQAGMPVTAHRFRDLLPPTVELIDRFARRDLEEECIQAYDFVEDRNDRAVLGGMLADLGDFLTPLLRRLDRTSMGASVECRVPFLDPRLAAKAANLPLDYKIGKRADKWVLKEVARRYMPAKLVDRPKMGFPLPLDDYIAPLADPAFFEGGFLETVLGFSRPGIERQLGQWRRFVYGTFGLVTLEMWGRLYLMGETVETLDARIAGLEAQAGLARAA